MFEFKKLNLWANIKNTIFIHSIDLIIEYGYMIIYTNYQPTNAQNGTFY